VRVVSTRCPTFIGEGGFLGVGGTSLFLAWRVKVFGLLGLFQLLPGFSTLSLLFVIIVILNRDFKTRWGTCMLP
jgi:hypothetical protein